MKAFQIVFVVESYQRSANTTYKRFYETWKKRIADRVSIAVTIDYTASTI